MSYIVSSNDKILRVRQEPYLMTEQGVHRLTQLMKYREYSVKAKENYEEINRNIKALVSGTSFFNTAIVSTNPELKEIKTSFQEVFA
jgi:hypothetical protein